MKNVVKYGFLGVLAIIGWLGVATVFVTVISFAFDKQMGAEQTSRQPVQPNLAILAPTVTPTNGQPSVVIESQAPLTVQSSNSTILLPTPTSATQLMVVPTATEEDKALSPLWFGDGTYEVGSEIKPGTYRSSGTDMCYWSRVSGFGGSFEEIIANGVGSQAIVTIQATDIGFETVGCGQWVSVDATASSLPAIEFGDGTYAVGIHILPGTYKADGSDMCYWARLADFSGEFTGILTNGINRTIVTISPDDAGFTTFGCGTWRIR